jgi:transposase
MQQQGSELDFSGQDIFVGLDVSNRSWKVAIVIGEIALRPFTQVPDANALVRYLKKHFPNGQYHCVYEAGYHGFQACEALRLLGVDCIVVNPADVPTTNKERVHKNDPVDARKLARSLANGELRGIYVPSRRELEDRSLIRMRAAVVKKQTRCKNQIRAFLAFHGVRMPPEVDDRYWSRRYIRTLQRLVFERPGATTALTVLIQELLYHRTVICDLTRQLRRLAREDHYAGATNVLLSVGGIGPVAAMTFMTELVRVTRFPTLDHLSSFCGLVPGEHSSGDTEQMTGLTPRRNPALRALLIQCAWAALRQDPALLQSFTRLCTRMKKQEAIIRIARKLLNRIRFVLLTGQPYRPGVVLAR